MAQTTDFLMYFRRIIKLHESMLKEICETYQLTMIEANIISFLYNNPGRDTARDIVELRMLSKGNVSHIPIPIPSKISMILNSIL